VNTWFRDIFWQFASKGIRFPLQFVIATLLARILDPDGVGKWSMVLAAGLLMAPLLTWTQVAAVRFGKKEWVAQGNIGGMLQGRSLWLVLGVTAACFLALVNPFGWLQKFYGLTGILVFATLIGLFGRWCMCEVLVAGQIRGDLRRFSIYQVIADILLVATLLLVDMLEWAVDRLPWIILALILGNTFVWAIAVFGELKRFGIFAPIYGDKSAWHIARYSWPLLPGALIAYSADWGNQLLLKFYFDVREVGLFQVAYMCMATIWGGAALLSVVVTPRLIARHIVDPEYTASWFVN